MSAVVDDRGEENRIEVDPAETLGTFSLALYGNRNHVKVGRGVELGGTRIEIHGDENVKGILINIYGGILRCDVLAEGVVQAAKKTGIEVPVVVRMEGTNVELGRRIQEDTGLAITLAYDLGDAARKIVAQVREAG